MQTDTKILTEEEIRRLFRTDIGHFEDKSILTHNKDTEVESIIMTGAEALIQQGKKQGLEQGKIDEKQAAVLRLMRLRFTEVSEAVVNEINRIEDFTLLDTLFEEAFNAETIEDIVLPNKNNGA